MDTWTEPMTGGENGWYSWVRLDKAGQMAKLGVLTSKTLKVEKCYSKGSADFHPCSLDCCFWIILCYSLPIPHHALQTVVSYLKDLKDRYIFNSYMHIPKRYLEKLKDPLN